jgi:hypothetical protein
VGRIQQRTWTAEDERSLDEHPGWHSRGAEGRW